MRSCKWLRGQICACSSRRMAFLLSISFARSFGQPLKNAPSRGAFFERSRSNPTVKGRKKTRLATSLDKWLRGQDLNHTTFGLWARRADQTAPPRDGTLHIILFFHKACQEEKRLFCRFFGFFEKSHVDDSGVAFVTLYGEGARCYFFSMVKPSLVMSFKVSKAVLRSNAFSESGKSP